MVQKLTTNVAQHAWAPDVVAVPAIEAIPDALVMQICQYVGFVNGDQPLLRVPLAKASAVIVPEGEAIPLDDPNMTEATVGTVKIGHLSMLSNELFSQEHTPALLSDAASRAVIAEADRVLLNQAAPKAGAVTPPAGLLAQAGASATVAGSFDGLITAVAAAQSAGADSRYQKLVLSPDSWAALRLMKSTDGTNFLGLGSMAVDGLEVPTVLGLPVLVNNQMPKGTGLLIDTKDAVAVYGDVLVAQDASLGFASDSQYLRTTFRFGGLLTTPAKHAKLSITATAPAA